MTATSPDRSVLRLYDRAAEDWARTRSRSLLERPWLEAFLSAMPDGGRDILDLGCGTGQPIAAHLLNAGYRVTGIDGAPAMISKAKEAVPAGEWHVADMRALPHSLGRFRGILAWHSLFHLTPRDQRAVLSRIGRLAAPGAALMFTSGPALGETVGTLAGEPLYHASLDPGDYRSILDRHRFDILRHVAEDQTCGGATIWLATRRPD